MKQAKDTEVPIAPGLFQELEQGTYLIGSRCRECGEVTFPANTFCPQCCRETTEKIPLSRRGQLYSFTVQRFRPPPPYKGPEKFEPYGVGMVELPEGLRVTSVLEEDDFSRLRVGMVMELVIKKIFEDEEGRAIVGYRFRPLEDDSQLEQSKSVQGERRRS
jgi:uncharacterized OB-fold protein